MAFDRSKYREQILKRTEESLAQRDYGSNTKYLAPDVPFQLWSWAVTKDGDRDHMIDIIPWLAGNKFPLPVDRKGLICKGDLVYVMRVQAHRNIGASKSWVVCPTRNYELLCPICEYIEEEVRKGRPWMEFTSINVKQRCAYYIVCYDSADQEKKGLQILEAAYEYTEKEFKPLAKKVRTNETIAFPDPDNGKSISFRIGNDERKTPSGFKLEDRDYVIDDNLLRLANKHPLDEYLVVKSYDEIKKIFYGADILIPQTILPKVDDDSDNPANYDVPELNKKEDKEDTECPVGNAYGSDNGKLEECTNCVVFDGCASEYEKIETLRRKNVESRRRRE